MTEFKVNEFDQIDETPDEQPMETARQVAIPINDMMRKRDLNHVVFEPLPKSSHLYIKSNVPDKDNGKMLYYKNLLQVTIRNFCIVFDLDIVRSKSTFNLRNRLSGNQKLYNMLSN